MGQSWRPLGALVEGRDQWMGWREKGCNGVATVAVLEVGME